MVVIVMLCRGDDQSGARKAVLDVQLNDSSGTSKSTIKTSKRIFLTFNVRIVDALAVSAVAAAGTSGRICFVDLIFFAIVLRRTLQTAEFFSL